LDLILRGAGAVLDQQGFEGLSTTTVARACGVSTATVYRHFPDKYAILKALFVHLQTARMEVLRPYYEAIAEGPDWRTPLAEATRKMWHLRRAEPGAQTSRRALQTSPELWLWDQRQNQEIADMLARSLRRRQPALTAPKAAKLALVCVHTSVSLLDLAGTLGPRQGRAVVDEIIEMRAAYLAPHLDITS
jgi:AcrR family transcriptional regulator